MEKNGTIEKSIRLDSNNKGLSRKLLFEIIYRDFVKLGKNLKYV